ncbi:MAG: hypothetical protein ABL986_08025 [Vicinamibacterales bacterium]
MKSWIVIVALLSTAHPIWGQSTPVSLLTPADGATVVHLQRLTGQVSDPEARVWLVIRPLEAPQEFWAQPPATVRNTGFWTATVYFGRSPQLDSGKHFEVRAFINPSKPLKPGLVSGWPDAEARSEVIELIRR